jgi:hypothetical protein
MVMKPRQDVKFDVSFGVFVFVACLRTDYQQVFQGTGPQRRFLDPSDEDGRRLDSHPVREDSVHRSFLSGVGEFARMGRRREVTVDAPISEPRAVVGVMNDAIDNGCQVTGDPDYQWAWGEFPGPEVYRAS